MYICGIKLRTDKLAQTEPFQPLRAHTQDDSPLVYSDDTARTYTLCGAVFSSISLHIIT